MQELLRDYDKIKEKNPWEPETNTEAESTTWPSRVAAHHILSLYQGTWSIKFRSFCKLKSMVREGLVQVSRVEMMSQEGKTI